MRGMFKGGENSYAVRIILVSFSVIDLAIIQVLERFIVWQFFCYTSFQLCICSCILLLITFSEASRTSIMGYLMSLSI